MTGLSAGQTGERDLNWFDFSTVADLSADGKTVLFYEWGAAVKGEKQVYVRRTDGSDVPRRLGEGKPLALSPDGNWAVVLRKTVPPQLVLLPTATGDERPLPRGKIGAFFDWAAWTSDSTRIFFAAEEPGQGKRTYVQDISGGQPEPVTPEPYAGTSLSPDDNILTVVGRYGGQYLYRLDTKEREPLALEDGDAVLQWASDGGSLFLRDRDLMRLKIFKLDLKTGRREFWKDLTPPHAVGLIGIAENPGTVRLTRDGSSYAYTYWTAPSELYLLRGLR
jgi:hypothetical protein